MARLWPRIFEDVSFSRYLWIFPLAAGVSWITTLSTLLIRWLSLGLPRYPGQVNPDVPFISDIAAFTFKPVFIVGCTITGISFAGTVFAVHHVRYSPKFYRLTNDAAWRQSVSFIALGCGLVAAVSLFFLSVFDTVDAHVRHRYLLMSTFSGLGLSAILTTLVWWDQTVGPARFGGLRRWCLLNTGLMICQTGVSIAFVALIYSGHYKSAGFVEWSLTYLGAFWLLSFVGYTRFREGLDPVPPSEDEQRPLLAP
ncbi:Frag1/DRAM/Sfk1 [Pseudomassariella vexata]|uniref:Frag1/DRAM/Sfk1 n=1 Tax=Pseudomassariella vexata TaxID=1141098 RepID=A0A1Y2DZI3_9PEZI|nr:Frag1/DRAM/Sfk1 [Pseudomassariella vexata]ORY64516.1 Frag1/DRAM/Sfk1 [Pseudomassariella vexata]